VAFCLNTRNYSHRIRTFQENTKKLCSVICRLAGDGFRGGHIYVASDKIGDWPIDKPVQPEHVATTVYDAVGIYDNLRGTNFFDQPFHLLTKSRRSRNPDKRTAYRLLWSVRGTPKRSHAADRDAGERGSDLAA